MATNRTGTSALSMSGAMFEHDMAEGFPMVTTKHMPFRIIATELEFFIQGHTSKKWLQERGCHIWDQWCNPLLLPEDVSPQQRKKLQRQEDDLGPIYGRQWRAFGDSLPQSKPQTKQPAPNIKHAKEKPLDQLAQLVSLLKNDPSSRRMLVSAWNPLQMPAMALPPCHVLFHVNVIGGKLHLCWFQRSCDLMLGIPFNIASYALLLHLLAKQANLAAGRLCGMLSNVHIYENHLPEARMQLTRLPLPLPNIQTRSSSQLEFEIFRWQHSDSQVKNYTPHPKINFNISV